MLRWIKALDRILRGEATRPDDLRRGTIDIPVGGLSAVVLGLGVLYGACMGVFAVVTRWDTPHVRDGLLQVASSAIKVPSLFFLTLLVTFPSLYVFNALVGSRLTFAAVLRLLVAALGVTMALLASFGTIVVFFSIITTSYAFVVLLNVLLFAVSGFLGLGFLLQTLHRMAAAATPVPAPYESAAESSPPALPSGEAVPHAPARNWNPPEGRSVKAVFRIWVIVFGLVGSQMGWVLRPFILHPQSDFQAFRPRESSFFQAVIEKVGELFEPVQSKWKPNRSDARNGGGSGRPKSTTQPTDAYQP